MGPIDRGGKTHIHIIEGEFLVVDAPDIVLTTILGSCIAACLHDPVARIGGMNHFLLPGEAEQFHADDMDRSGLRLMESLIGELLARGAQRSRLVCKLFGGAYMHKGLPDIGAKNTSFAKRFLEKERICIVAGDVGGMDARRVEYHPSTGAARKLIVR